MTVVSRPVQALGFAVVRARSRPTPTGIELLDAHRDFECLTSVVRVPSDAAARVVTVARALPGASEHYVYLPGDLHLTVLNLDAVRSTVPELLRTTEQVATSALRFPVELRGLGMTGQSIYVQAWDPTGSLCRLRAGMAAATGCGASLPRRLLGFVNIVRFRHPRVDELRAERGRWRRLALGSFVVGEVEVVRTNKVLAATATTVVGRFPLG